MQGVNPCPGFLIVSTEKDMSTAKLHRDCGEFKARAVKGSPLMNSLKDNFNRVTCKHNLQVKGHPAEPKPSTEAVSIGRRGIWQTVGRGLGLPKL